MTHSHPLVEGKLKKVYNRATGRYGYVVEGRPELQDPNMGAVET